ncbi:unnamed protein product [Blepharisma stoltei]|uniref:UBC core domain-containing protein n=1 Tax=Blepharisma stoltei TaxID=1481888 RepID=A0AAU9K567_9CILI|nr:unnamed protein product [Blepharisma stoltei]
MAIRRIRREINDECLLYHEPEVNFWPNDPNDLFNCRGVIMGPINSVYENGMFFLNAQYPADYPFKPPKIAFTTKIYHPCISSKGGISLGILNCDWSPALTMHKVLLSIQNLMLEFDVDSPLVPDIAYQYKLDRSKYDYIAREWTELYAI